MSSIQTILTAIINEYSLLKLQNVLKQGHVSYTLYMHSNGNFHISQSLQQASAYLAPFVFCPATLQIFISPSSVEQRHASIFSHFVIPRTGAELNKTTAKAKIRSFILKNTGIVYGE